MINTNVVNVYEKVWSLVEVLTKEVKVQVFSPCLFCYYEKSEEIRQVSLIQNRKEQVV